ncbi:ribosomal protection-like ABC-F family protein [Hominifimenecus sp. rT4P-3]|uniref:ribosomal protection-like ABC-F family protein n=1 Tax=Hominifimenecus sp. rT4P-3 TaxID=3242979 RepID=UPI003DA6C172
MILSCNNLSKAFLEEPLFSGGSFRIEEKEKAAIVGINGAGKSTLLKILIGELTPDTGEVVLAKGKTIGYLAQHQDLSTDRTIYEEVLEAKQDVLALEKEIRRLESAMKAASGEELASMMETYARLNHTFEQKDGYACQSEIAGILKGLGFTEDEFQKKYATLSGGQKTRVALGRLLLEKPDLLLLDEPTNHLDIHSVTWLENYLRGYGGSVILVAHDRYFLDRIVTKVIEVEGGKISSFSGNYTAYAEKKKMLREAALHQYLNQQQEIKRQEAVIAKLRSFNREKSIKRAESREKLLAKTERLEKPVELKDSMFFTLEPNEMSGNDVLSVKNLSKSYGSHHLFENVNIDIKRGERVAIIGANGTGKTTLLKIINGLVPPDTGDFTLGSRVAIGYYDQEQQLLTEENTLFDEIQNAYPTLNNTTIRNTLAAFLFTGDDVFKRVSDLSGGERGRLALAKLILSPCNFLILDEPTNHLDMTSKEILEQALSHYTGTILYVSHDRYFVNQTATRILELTGGTFINYLGNYDYYLEKKEELTAVYTAPAEEIVSGKSASDTGNADWKAQKEEQARERKRKNDMKKIEEKIDSLEKRSAEIDELLTHEDIYTNVSECLKLNREQEELKKTMDELFEEWEALESQ